MRIWKGCEGHEGSGGLQALEKGSREGLGRLQWSRESGRDCVGSGGDLGRAAGCCGLRCGAAGECRCGR